MDCSTKQVRRGDKIKEARIQKGTVHYIIIPPPVTVAALLFAAGVLSAAIKSSVDVGGFACIISLGLLGTFITSFSSGVLLVEVKVVEDFHRSRMERVGFLT